VTDRLAAASPVPPTSPTLARALACWQHAAGPYWPYVAATPFVGDVSEDWVRRVVHAELARRGADAARTRRRGDGETRVVGGGRVLHSILALAGDDRAAIFVDLPPKRALPATAELNRLGFIVVPVVQRWVVSSAVLDCRTLVARLVIDGERSRHPARERGVVFVLDGDRAGPPGYAPGPRVPRRFDNRYAYPPDRLPPPTFLRAHGIVAARWLGPARDLQTYRDNLARSLLPDPRPPTLDPYDAPAPR
jgi:hypothetical protein